MDLQACYFNSGHVFPHLGVRGSSRQARDCFLNTFPTICIFMHAQTACPHSNYTSILHIKLNGHCHEPPINELTSRRNIKKFLRCHWHRWNLSAVDLTAHHQQLIENYGVSVIQYIQYLALCLFPTVCPHKDHNPEIKSFQIQLVINKFMEMNFLKRIRCHWHRGDLLLNCPSNFLGVNDTAKSDRLQIGTFMRNGFNLRTLKNRGSRISWLCPLKSCTTVFWLLNVAKSRQSHP
jgi:hypothetical protein